MSRAARRRDEQDQGVPLVPEDPGVWWLQLGTVPDWIAAAGTVFAFVALVIELRKTRSELARREREQEEEARRAAVAARQEQVSRVTCWLEFPNSSGIAEDVVARVSNASAMAIYDVEVGLVGLDATDLKRLPVVAPGQVEVASWHAVERTAAAQPDARVVFRDANGVRWLREGSRFTEAPGEG